MQLARVHGERQEVLMSMKHLVEAKAVTDDDVLGAERRAREVAAVGSAENFDEIFPTLDTQQQLVHELTVVHENPAA